jgi:hypothetical protein
MVTCNDVTLILTLFILDNAAYSTVLKTGLTFGYQPVCVDDCLKTVLAFFLTKVRPLLRAVMSKEMLTDKSGLLCPAWGPTAMEPISKDPIKRFCKKHMGTATTTTDMRAMWEMKAGHMVDNGNNLF